MGLQLLKPNDIKSAFFNLNENNIIPLSKIKKAF